MGHNEAVVLAPLAGVVVRPVVGVLRGAPGEIRPVVNTCSHLQEKDKIFHKARCFQIFHDFKTVFVFHIASVFLAGVTLIVINRISK